MVDVSDVELNTAEFKGYVTARLEDIVKKLEVLDKCVDKMKIRVAAIGGTISLVVTVLVLLLDKVIK
jgi:hypothetical protein